MKELQEIEARAVKTNNAILYKVINHYRQNNDLNVLFDTIENQAQELEQLKYIEKRIERIVQNQKERIDYLVENNQTLRNQLKEAVNTLKLIANMNPHPPLARAKAKNALSHIQGKEGKP